MRALEIFLAGVCFGIVVAVLVHLIVPSPPLDYYIVGVLLLLFFVGFVKALMSNQGPPPPPFFPRRP